MTDTMSGIRPPDAGANQLAAAAMGLGKKPQEGMALPQADTLPVTSSQPAAEPGFSAEKFDPTPTPVGDDGEISSSPADGAEPISPPEATVAPDGSLEVNHGHDASKDYELPPNDAEDEPAKPLGTIEQAQEPVGSSDYQEAAETTEAEKQEGTAEKDSSYFKPTVYDELYDSSPDYFSKLSAKEFMKIGRDLKRLRADSDQAKEREKAFFAKFKVFKSPKESRLVDL